LWYFRSPQIVYGPDSLSFLQTIGISRAAIITDSTLAASGIVQKVIQSLPENASSKVFSGFSPEPDFLQIKSNLEGVNAFRPDWIIGVGGGSSMDAAKIIFAMYEKPDLQVYDITPLSPLGLRKKSRLIAVPTTSGTGSECSWAAVISEREEKRKNELASPEILPDYAILDPEMVINLPRQQTVSTSVDAITHAIESYTSSWNNPYSDALSEKALELILGSLVQVVEGNGDIESRDRVHIGASMAGLSFSNSQIGMAHALGHAFGAIFKKPHGTSVGLFLPEVVALNSRASRERYDRLNRIFPDSFREGNLQSSLKKLFARIGQPLTVKEAGIGRKEMESNRDALVSLAMESTGMLTNPYEAGTDEVRETLERCYGY
jgi:alcohol dehydrogenase class IV